MQMQNFADGVVLTFLGVMMSVAAVAFLMFGSFILSIYREARSKRQTGPYPMPDSPQIAGETAAPAEEEAEVLAA